MTAAQRLAEARTALAEQAGRVATFGAALDEERLAEYGDGVPGALAALQAALEPGGDVPGVERAARGLAEAATVSFDDLEWRGLEDPAVPFGVALFGLRRLLLTVDMAAADVANETRGAGEPG